MTNEKRNEIMAILQKFETLHGVDPECDYHDAREWTWNLITAMAEEVADREDREFWSALSTALIKYREADLYE